MKHAVPTTALLLALGLPITAQAPELPPELPPGVFPSAGQEALQEAPETEVRFLKHLLHLQGGGVLRVKARVAADGNWEIQERGSARILPAHQVTRAALEKDVRKQARSLEKELKKGDTTRRVAYAEWLLHEGLVEEGLEELDRVLRQDPDQRDALRLLERDAPRIAHPPLSTGTAEELDEFVRFACNTKPAAKEILIDRLGEVNDEAVRAKLAAELHVSSVRRRAFATHALRRLFPGTEIQSLLNRAVLDGSESVRVGASQALRDAQEPAVILPVLRALESSSSAVRKNAAEALGHMGYRQAVAPLYNHLVAVSSNAAQFGGGYTAPRSHIYVGRQMAYVQDYDVEVAQGAAIADPVVNTLTEGSILDVRVLAVSASQIQSERASVRRALAHLTGASPGSTTRAWNSWWAENGADWTGEPGPSTPSSPGR